MTPTEQAVRDLLIPIVRDLELQIYDVEVNSGTLRVLLDKDGGIDMGSITSATRQLSRALDASDPISSSYTLEVSSPGLERTLRLPEHFSGAVGSRVKIKTRADSSLERRLGGVLESFDDPVLSVRSDDGDAVEVRLDQIERARTEFVVESNPKPGKGPSAKNAPSNGPAIQNAKSKTRSDTSS